MSPLSASFNQPAPFPSPVPPPPAAGAVRTGLAAILLLAAVVRLVGLDSIPPGLWYDEAIYALDGLEAATRGPRLFYTTENHMREPLYIWSLGGFFALFGSSVVKARLVSAIWGIATVAALWPVARRVFWDEARRVQLSADQPSARASCFGIPAPDAWGLAAVFAFAVFRWHVHFSRTIFRALLPSLFILLVVWSFRRWQERRRGGNAVLTGALLGAGIYTYLSFRLVPLLLGAWAMWLLIRGRLSWRGSRAHFASLAGAAFLVFAPLLYDWVAHPEHFSGRTEEVSMFKKTVRMAGSDGVVREQVIAKPPLETLRDLGGNALQVAGMWTLRGDHVGKHNLPYAPVFDWANGLVFYAGLLWCLLNIARSEWAFLTLAWLAILSLTSIFSFGAPNILRMQGAAPAAILSYALGLRWLASGLAQAGASLPVRAGAVGAILLLFAALQLDTYFRRFPVHPQVRQEFLAEMFAAPAEAVMERAEVRQREAGDLSQRTTAILVPQEMAATPTFKFITAGAEGLVPYGPDLDLPTTSGARLDILVTARAQQLARDAGKDLKAQLYTRPGARLLESFPVTIPGPHGQTRRAPWAELWTLGEAIKNEELRIKN